MAGPTLLEPGAVSSVACWREISMREGSLNEKVATALCLAFLFWAVLFGVPMPGKSGRISDDVGRVAQLGH